MYRKILSAVDGSFHSELAARHAIATSCGSELVVLTVDTGEVEREDLSAAVERVCHQAGSCGIYPSGAVRSGEVVKTILDAITAEHADLVVAATRRGDRRFFVRSINKKLMLKAPCSVLAVKPTGIASALPQGNLHYLCGYRGRTDGQRLNLSVGKGIPL